MSAVDERTAIGQLFETGWGSATPISWPNVAFDPLTEGTYVKFSIVRGETDPIEIGGTVATKRATGRVYVQVFVPLGSGDALARAWCDQVSQIFRSTKQISLSDGRVLFREPNTRDIGAVGPHYQFNVSIPYLYDML